jgi:hypothetical protein
VRINDLAAVTTCDECGGQFSWCLTGAGKPYRCEFKLEGDNEREKGQAREIETKQYTQVAIRL